MTPPVNDASSLPGSPPSTSLTPRQRLESLLAHLPPAGSVVGLAPQEGLAADVTHGALVEPIQRVNAVMRSYGVEFDLQAYDSRVVTRIVDRESGEVIRQIPSEEVLRIAESLEQVQGRLIQYKA